MKEVASSACDLSSHAEACPQDVHHLRKSSRGSVYISHFITWSIKRATELSRFNKITPFLLMHKGH